MKILIVGAGAVGIFLGGKLALAGHEPVFYHPREDYCRTLNAHPVEITYQGRTEMVEVTAGSNPALLFQNNTVFPLAMIAVKSYATRSACESLSPYFSQIGHVLTVQNGLGNEEILLEYFDASRITAGSLTLACSFPDEGVIAVESEGSGGLALASLDFSGRPLVAETFRETGFPVQWIPDWRRMKWSKLLLNITANAIPALLDMDAEEVFSDSRLFQRERRALREAVQIMEAWGIRPVNLPGFPVPWFVRAIQRLPSPLLQLILKRKIANARGSKMASLRIDFLKGKRETEFFFLYGILVQKGKEKGINAPVLSSLVSLLEQVSRGQVAWETFRKRPEALLDRIGDTSHEQVVNNG